MIHRQRHSWVLTMCLVLFLGCGFQNLKTTGSGVRAMPFPSFHHRKIPDYGSWPDKSLGEDASGQQDSRISKMNFSTVAWKALEIPTTLWKTTNGPEYSASAWPHPSWAQRLCSASLCLAAGLSCGLCWWSGLVLWKAVLFLQISFASPLPMSHLSLTQPYPISQ